MPGIASSPGQVTRPLQEAAGPRIGDRQRDINSKAFRCAPREDTAAFQAHRIANVGTWGVTKGHEKQPWLASPGSVGRGKGTSKLENFADSLSQPPAPTKSDP